LRLMSSQNRRRMPPQGTACEKPDRRVAVPTVDCSKKDGRIRAAPMIVK
jgi:hypothetical protein